MASERTKKGHAKERTREMTMPSKTSVYHQYRYLYFSLLLIIALIPLPHGGELFWEHAPFIIATFVLLSIWLFQQWRHKQPLPKIILTNKIPLILLAIWLAYIFLQTISMPESWLKLINPSTYNLNTHAIAIGVTPTNSLSIDADKTLNEFFRYCSYIIIFFLLLALCDSRKRIKQLALTIFAAGFIQALYSLINYYTQGAYSLNQPIPPWGTPWAEATRGTYTHRNHFAALMEMTIPIGIGMLISLSHRPAQNSLLTTTLDFIMSARLLYITCICLMLSALIFSTSRGGIGAFVLSFLLTLTIFAVTQRKKTQLVKPLAIGVLTIVFVTMLAGTGSFMKRFDKHGFSPNQRDLMLTTAYKLTTEFPLTGSGAGTYPYIYYQYKVPELGVSPMSKRAHNDYLELTSDQGIIGALIFGSAISLIIIRLLPSLKSINNPQSHGLLFGSLFGINSVTIHSMVEFNFHIPANTTYFFALIVLALVSSQINSPRKSGDHN